MEYDRERFVRQSFIFEHAMGDRVIRTGLQLIVVELAVGESEDCRV